MTHPLGTLRDAFKLMQDLLDNKESLLNLNEILWKKYDRLIGSLAQHRRHLLDPVLRRFLDGQDLSDTALARMDDEEIERVFARRHLPAPA